MHLPLTLFLLLTSSLASASQVPIISPMDNGPHINSGLPTLADLLTIQPRTSIYFSYARETDLSEMLEKEGGYLSAFVPTNKAVMELARKPHQGPAPPQRSPSDEKPEVEISEAQFEKESKDNVKQWVSAHLVPGEIHFPSAHQTSAYPTVLSGLSISIEYALAVEEGKGMWTGMKVEGSRIVDMKKGSNGVLYIIDGTIEVPEDT